MYTLFEQAHKLEVPQDLADAFAQRPGAAERFALLTGSRQKSTLQYIAMAKRAETRAARIEKAAKAAERGSDVHGVTPESVRSRILAETIHLRPRVHCTLAGRPSES